MSRLSVGYLLFALSFLLSPAVVADKIPPKQAIAALPAEPPAPPVLYHEVGSAFRTSLDLIAEYLSATPERGGERILADNLKNHIINRNWHFQFVIVTIPGNEYGYESHLEAVQRAAASLGYRVQSQWLPGPGAGASGENSSSNESASPPEKLRARTASGSYPGVILLRPPRLKVDPKRQEARLELEDHLLIYVVDESPNGGIALRDFERALTQIAIVSSIQSPGPPDLTNLDYQVAILGPTFSGSRNSLALALAGSSFRGNFKFNIVSGRASSSENFPIMDKLLQGKTIAMNFSTAMHSVITQFQAMLDYICIYEEFNENKTSGNTPQVALLVESSTNWGQELQQAIAGKMKCTKHQGGKTIQLPVPLLVLPYQIHIADTAQLPDQVQAESALAAVKGEPGARPASPAGERNTPAMRSLSGLRSEERALTSLLRTIAQEQIWYVGVASLTAADKYLLLRRVHELMPGAQLFALDADLNDTHPEYLPFTKGMLAASTYPVFTKTQLWQWPLLGDTQRIQFPRSRDIGVYNAFIFLLADRNPSEPRVLKSLISYSPSVLPQPGVPLELPSHWVPSLWISRVTGEGVIPVKEYPQPPPAPGQPAKIASAIRPLAATSDSLQVKLTADDSYLGVRRTGAFDIIIVLSSLYFFISLLVYIFHRFFSGFIAQHPELNLFGVFSLPRRKRASTPPLAEPSLEEAVRLLQSDGLSRFYRVLYFSALAGFIAILQSHSLPLTLRTRLADGADLCLFEYGTELFMGVLFGFLVTTAVDALCFGCQSDLRSRDRQVKREAGLYAFFGSLTAAVFLIINFRRSAAQMYDMDRLLYLERSTNFSSGLSILAPWLCLLSLIIAWAAANRHRIGLLARIHEDFGALKDAGDPADLEAIALALGGGWKLQPIRMMRAISVSVILVGLFIYAHVFYGITTYESGSELLGFGFAFSYCAIISEFVIFVIVAYYFDRSLLMLGSEPMFDAYQRLPVHFSRNIGIQILESLNSHIEYQSIRANMAVLKTHYKRIVDVLKGNDSQSEKTLQGLFGTTAGSLLAMGGPAKSTPNNAAEKLYKLLTVDLESQPQMLHVDSQSGDQKIHQRKLDPVVADGVATVAEFLHAVNRERPLPSSVQPLVPKNSDKAEERGPGKPDMDVNRVRGVGTRELLTQTLPDSLHLWLRQAEDLVAIQRVMFINRVFSALRSQLTFVATGLVLLLLAFNLFPFQPLRLMMTVLGALMLVILPITLWIFIRLERDEVLSYISHSPPGQLSLTGPFIGRLFAYIGVPLLTFLIAQIPWLRALFVEVISPTIMGLR